MKIKNSFIIIGLLGVLLFPRVSYAWGDGIPGALLKQSMEQIERGIEGTILGAVKTAAVTSISAQVDRLLNGTGVGQPLFIRDYDDYLRYQPQLEAQTYVHNFLTRTYRGLGSTSNYTSASGSGSLRGGHETQLEGMVRRSVLNNDEFRYDLNEYCRPSVEEGLKRGDPVCLDAWRRNPANNPYGAALRAEYEYQRVYNEIRFQRQLMALDDGFQPGVDPRTGQIVTPSSSVAALYNDAKTLGSKILAGAQNPAELASGVVFALVNRSINTIASKAAGAVEDLVDRTVGRAVTEINRVSGDIGNVIRTVDGYILTADGYITEAGYQAEEAARLRQQVNSNTQAPPAPVGP